MRPYSMFEWWRRSVSPEVADALMRLVTKVWLATIGAMIGYANPAPMCLADEVVIMRIWLRMLFDARLRPDRLLIPELSRSRLKDGVLARPRGVPLEVPVAVWR